MSVPYKKRTLGSKKRRASHFALKGKNIVKCEKCDKPRLPHQACSACGYYKGKSIFDAVIKPKKNSKAAAEKK